MDEKMDVRKMGEIGERKSEAIDGLDSLKTNVNELGLLVKELAERLSPVMREIQPEITAGAIDCGGAESISPIRKQVGAIADTVNETRDRLQSILQHLEV